MKSLALLTAILMLSYSYSSSATSLRSEQIQRQIDAQEQQQTSGTARIVGGSDTDLGDYPFMSALVFVSQEINTSANVDGTDYDSSDFSFAPSGEASAELVSCGLAGEVCEGVEDKICLIERGEFTFANKTLNCQSGGGIGAIIYNNVEGALDSGTLGNDFSGTIPIVAISQADGEIIAQLQGVTASISVSVEAGSTQDSNCGATFIGDKWVLTAAHCVDSEFSNQLRVNVGEYDLRDGADDAVPIARIYLHPNYSDNDFDSDVALLELTRSVEATAITLADAQTTLAFTQVNEIAKSIGWGGRTAYGPGEGPTGNFPDILQEVELPLLTNTQCRNIFADSRNTTSSQTGVTDNMICAAVDMGGKSACQGDSGGPLFVETNSGPVQVGITSWGIGCAAEGYPGVYARVGELLDFIDATRFGVGVSGEARFTNSPVGNPFGQSYTITNNSTSSVTPAFSLSNSTDFELDSSGCGLLAAGESCELSIAINASSVGEKQTSLTVESDVNDIPTNGITVQGFAVGAASALENAIGTSNSAVSVFSGGDQSWVVNNTGGVTSGNISDRQESILVVQIEGEGTLQFNWSVSSEENVDEPTEPFDALYLIVNGEEQSFISGAVPFSAQTVELAAGTNLVEFAYRKDPGVSELDDSGSVRNLTFTPAQGTTPAPTPTTPSTGGGGGAMSVLALLVIISLSLRRRKTQ